MHAQVSPRKVIKPMLIWQNLWEYPQILKPMTCNILCVPSIFWIEDTHTQQGVIGGNIVSVQKYPFPHKKEDNYKPMGGRGKESLYWGKSTNIKWSQIWNQQWGKSAWWPRDGIYRASHNRTSALSPFLQNGEPEADREGTWAKKTWSAFRESVICPLQEMSRSWRTEKC